MTDRLPATPEGLAAAVELLRAGALVAFPTDTVYGLGCRAGDADALTRIFEAKRRPPDKLVPILVASLEQARDLGYTVDDRARALAGRWWPGALTLILASSADVSASTQGFRVPDHPLALELIRQSGPLLTSSANRSGEPETYDPDDVLVAFADTDLVAAVLDGGLVPGGVASSVVDLSMVPSRVLREGPITREQLAEVIGTLD
ncbi:MAG: L-threonylcarbamoyladenylate synthase [Chloroflexota bacterium]|nr:L-threonylcarbamoyladenylate synthase [Chloroflexota bacterium]